MRTISLVISLVFSLAISASDVWVVSVKTTVKSSVESCWVVTHKPSKDLKDCACSSQCVCGCNDGKPCDCGKASISYGSSTLPYARQVFTSEPVCIGGT